MAQDWLTDDVAREKCTRHRLDKALPDAETQVIEDTGETKAMNAEERGERMAYLVEVLIPEDELARVCYYCNVIETADPEQRSTKISGEGYMSLHRCSEVRERLLTHRFLRHM